jgi:SAM-dependent methyltransferase
MTDESVLEAQRRLWAGGDYSAIAPHLLPVSVETLDVAGVTAGQEVLDVGVGDGNTAIEAARRGAVVTGLDISPQQLELARRRIAAEGLSVELREGNAEALPFDDASFDLVVSVLGVIFAPDHARAVAEMARVCRPGGVVAVAAWVDSGWFRIWRDRAQRLVPATPAADGPRPDLWGQPGEPGRRLQAAGLDTREEPRDFYWSFPTTRDCAAFFLEVAPPFTAFQQSATEAGHGDEVLPLLLSAMDEVNVATDGTCRLLSPYVVAVGRRHEA